MINPLRYSFSAKNGFIVFAAICITMGIASLIMYNGSNQRIVQQTGNVYQSRMEYSIDSIDSVVRQIDQAARAACLNERLGKILKYPSDFEHTEHIQGFQYLNQMMSGLKDANPSIHSIYVRSRENGWIVGSDLGRTVQPGEADEYDWTRQSDFMQFEKRFICESIPDSKGNSINLICCSNSITDSVTGQRLGAMSLNLDCDYVFRLFEKISFGEDASLLVLDKKTGETIYSAGLSPEELTELKEKAGGIKPGGGSGYAYSGAGRSIVLVAGSEYLDFKYIVKTTIAETVDLASTMIPLLVTTIILSFLAAICSSILVARHISVPINTLKNAMRKVRNGQSFRIGEERSDEFGQLYGGFNDMMDNITSLTKATLLQEAEKKDMRLKMMYSQINAHFLYNTLDVIHWIAKTHKAPVISELVMELSQYYRIGLSSGADAIALTDIVKQIQSYLKILHLKDDADIELCVDIPTELQSVCILKYIFQPLVENAVQHGFINKEKSRIDFSAKDREGDLYLTLSDNGQGMSAGRLRELNEYINREHIVDESFALRNIRQQIEVFYGPGASLTVDSEENKGTTVTIIIPKGEWGNV